MQLQQNIKKIRAGFLLSDQLQKTHSTFFSELDRIINSEFATLIGSEDQLLSLDLLFFDQDNINQIKNFEKLNICFKQSYLLVRQLDFEISIDLIHNLKINRVICYQDFNFNLFMNEILDFDQKIQDELSIRMNLEAQKKDSELIQDLEAQLIQEQTELINRRQKILDANKKSEALRKILYHLSVNIDIAQAETILNEYLPQNSTAIWIKIISKENVESFEADLINQLPNYYLKKQCFNYLIFFIKNDKSKFRSSDDDFFSKICDALELNLTTQHLLATELENEKIITKAFNSTLNPLLIVDKNYNIIEANPAFRRHDSKDNKCYQVMFKRETPCLGCKLGQKFIIEDNSSIQMPIQYFSVLSHKTQNAQETKSQWVHFYSDITEEKIYEQRLSQTAKMKELGLISSSIAHELNNPLGGIISYLQIIQMDLPINHRFQSDLKEMLSACDRMKKIIQNLLLFSRKPMIKEKTLKLINELVMESFEVNELNFKADNIKFIFNQNDSTHSIKLFVSESEFKDSLFLIYNYFIHGLKIFRQDKTNFPGLIEVKFSSDQINFYLNLECNMGPLGLDLKSKDIHFLIIHKSITDQNFQVQLTSPSAHWIGIQIIIPRSGNSV